MLQLNRNGLRYISTFILHAPDSFRHCLPADETYAQLRDCSPFESEKRSSYKDLPRRLLLHMLFRLGERNARDFLEPIRMHRTVDVNNLQLHISLSDRCKGYCTMPVMCQHVLQMSLTTSINPRRMKCLFASFG
jgi:hypothetical protein